MSRKKPQPVDMGRRVLAETLAHQEAEVGRSGLTNPNVWEKVPTEGILGMLKPVVLDRVNDLLEKLRSTGKRPGSPER